MKALVILGLILYVSRFSGSSNELDHEDCACCRAKEKKEEPKAQSGILETVLAKGQSWSSMFLKAMIAFSLIGGQIALEVIKSMK